MIKTYRRIDVQKDWVYAVTDTLTPPPAGKGTLYLDRDEAVAAMKNRDQARLWKARLNTTPTFGNWITQYVKGHTS